RVVEEDLLVGVPPFDFVDVGVVVAGQTPVRHERQVASVWRYPSRQVDEQARVQVRVEPVGGVFAGETRDEAPGPGAAFVVQDVEVAGRARGKRLPRFRRAASRRRAGRSGEDAVADEIDIGAVFGGAERHALHGYAFAAVGGQIAELARELAAHFDAF